MNKILIEFLGDTAESLEGIEAELLRLEAHSGDAAPFNAILREFHGVKGSAGFLSLARLSTLAECAESYLAGARAAGGVLTPRGADVMLRCLDRMRGIMAGIKRTGREPVGDDSALVNEMLLGASGQARTVSLDDDTAPLSAQQTVRVDIEALNALAAMADELARARESLARLAAVTSAANAQPSLAALHKTSGDLIALADRLRRRPANEAWRPLRRIARDAATALGKDVEIVFSGDHIAVEAHIIEGLRAPLAHLVRNAIAHGIESPAERTKRGKPHSGRIEVSIRIEPDGDIVMDIGDDGAGLDPATIRRRGIENGMISAANAARMTDDETIALLFAPGFSTTARLNAYAGRGIGLNAAKAAVESLGGKLEAERAALQGALFRIRIPRSAPPTQVVRVDPSEPAHSRIASRLSAAGYDLEHQAAEALSPHEKTEPAATLKEKSA